VGQLRSGVFAVSVFPVFFVAGAERHTVIVSWPFVTAGSGKQRQ
jgi:hypothetical protein